MKYQKYVNIIVVMLVAIIFIIVNDKFNIGIPCIFNKITGLYCPGCGITRAIISLLHFNVYKAFRYNMLVVLLIPFVSIYLFYKYAMKGNWKIPNYVWYFLVVITIAFGVLRNIPYFSFLAPLDI